MRGGIRSRDPAALQGRRAGFVSRVLAAVIDLAVLWLFGLAIVLLASMVRFVVLGPPFVVSSLPPVALTPASFAAGVLYLTYFWAAMGRTPGQHVFGLRVVDRGDGRSARSGPSCGRRSASSSRSGCCGSW